MRHEELLERVRELLRGSIELRYVGALHRRKIEAQAYADGYMRALTDSGQLGAGVLLSLVREERARSHQRASLGERLWGEARAASAGEVARGSDTTRSAGAYEHSDRAQ
jgi:hypothetical protein